MKKITTLNRTAKNSAIRDIKKENKRIIPLKQVRAVQARYRVI